MCLPRPTSSSFQPSSRTPTISLSNTSRLLRHLDISSAATMRVSSDCTLSIYSPLSLYYYVRTSGGSEQYELQGQELSADAIGLRQAPAAGVLRRMATCGCVRGPTFATPLVAGIIG